MNGCLTLDVGTLLAILLFPNQDPLVAHTVLREVYSSLSYMKLIEAHFNTVRRSISGLDHKVRPQPPEISTSNNIIFISGLFLQKPAGYLQKPAYISARHETWMKRVKNANALGCVKNSKSKFMNA